MIYIVCPSKYATGGTELLHQLCVEICSHNIDAAIVYDGDMTYSPIINNSTFPPVNQAFISDLQVGKLS